MARGSPLPRRHQPGQSTADAKTHVEPISSPMRVLLTWWWW